MEFASQTVLSFDMNRKRQVAAEAGVFAATRQIHLLISITPPDSRLGRVILPR
jgi:hypothetical protein